MNTVTASFNTTARKMTEMSQRKKAYFTFSFIGAHLLRSSGLVIFDVSG